jgi:ADP-ribose pyrophosphatase
MRANPIVLQDWERYLRLTRDDAKGNVADGEIRVIIDANEIEEVAAACFSGEVPTHAPITDYKIGIVYLDEYVAVLRDLVQFPSGAYGTYIRVLPSSAQILGVCVVPLHDGRVFLMRQFRHATRRWHLELPKGFAESGEPPRTAAARELGEETSAHPLRLRYLGDVYTDVGLLARCVQIFAAEVSEPAALGGDYGSASLASYTRIEVEDLIKTRQIDDGLTLSALQLLWHRS